MPEVHQLQPSFSAGELAPTLYARVDFTKYHIGTATMRNFYVDVRGGASTRPGTEFCQFSGDQHQPGILPQALGTLGPFSPGSQLFPFLVGQQDGYVVEMGQQDDSLPGYARFVQNARYVFNPTTKAITGATNASPAVITALGHGLSAWMVVYITGVVGMTQLNGWWQVQSATTNTFTIAPLPFYNAAAQSSTSWGTWSSGGTINIVQQISTPYKAGDLLRLKYSQSADVMILTHPNYAPGQIVLGANGLFTYSAITPGGNQAAPSSLVVSDGGTTDPDYCWSYRVTATSLDGKSESLPTAPAFRHYTIPDDVTGWAEQLKWSASADPSLMYTVYKGGPFDDRIATGPGTIWGRIGNAQTTVFSDNNIPPDFAHQPPIFGDPFSGGQCEEIVVATGGSGYPSAQSWTGYVALSFAISGPLNANAVAPTGWAVTNYQGVVTGAFLDTAGRNMVNDGGSNTVVASAGAGGATFTLTIAPLTPTFPACSAFYEQRLLLGGSASKPDTIVGSVPGDYFNFNITAIPQDTDALVLDIASVEVDTVQSFMPVSYGCLIFTTGGIYLFNGGSTQQAGAPLTPESATFVAQAASGANWLQPLRINWSVLYVQFRGNVVRDLSFAWQRQSYTGNDISMLSSHLFFGFELLSWTWSEELWRQVLLVREDGILLTLTYVPEQEIYGWSRWDTQGEYQSVVSIPEGDFNVNYALVRRHVALTGATPCWVTYLERFDPRQWDCLIDVWPLDCAVSNPKIFPNYPLFLSLNADGSVNFQLYDPCVNSVPSGNGPFGSGSGTQYTMEARENLSSLASEELFDAPTPPTAGTTNPWVDTDNSQIGYSFDYTRRVISYSGAILTSPTVLPEFPMTFNNLGPPTITNNSTFAIWDGANLTIPGATISSNTLPIYFAQKSIDTDAVTYYQTYTDAFSIPQFAWCGLPELDNPGTGYTHCSVTVTGSATGQGMVIEAIVDAGGGGQIVDLMVKNWGYNYKATDTLTLTFTGDGTGAAGSFNMNSITGLNQTFAGSDGSWKRMMVDYILKLPGNNPVVIDPRTSNAFMLTQCCELYQLNYIDNFEQRIIPYLFMRSGGYSPGNGSNSTGVTGVSPIAFGSGYSTVTVTVTPAAGETGTTGPTVIPFIGNQIILTFTGYLGLNVALQIVEAPTGVTQLGINEYLTSSDINGNVLFVPETANGTIILQAVGATFDPVGDANNPPSMMQQIIINIPVGMTAGNPATITSVTLLTPGRGPEWNLSGVYGMVTAYAVTAPGNYHKTPTVTVSGDGSGALAFATVSFVFDHSSFPTSVNTIPSGIDASWVYCLVNVNGLNPVAQSNNFLRGFCLVPTTIQPDEVTADQKLAYVIYTSGSFLNDWGVKLTFGFFNELYFLSVYPASHVSGGHWAFRLSKFNPPPVGNYGSNLPGQLHDITSLLWSASTGPNADGALYNTSSSNFPVPSYCQTMSFIRLPATSQLAFILRFYPSFIITSSGDVYTDTKFSMGYITPGSSPTLDYHSGFVTGYMSSAWAPTVKASAAYAVLDMREINPYLDQTDFVYPGEDYTTRWFAFDTYLVSGGVVGSTLTTVFVQYQFVSGAVPVVKQVIPEAGWDTAYAAYGTTIGASNVVQASLAKFIAPSINTYAGQGACSLTQDTGIWDPQTRSWWFSGMTETVTSIDSVYNNMFYLNPEFTPRAAYNTNVSMVPNKGLVVPPFLRLTVSPGTGQVIQAGCSLLRVTSLTNNFAGTAEIQLNALAPAQVFTDDPTTIIPFSPGDWDIGTPTNYMTNVGHLTGKTVWALADGTVCGPMTVSSTGTVELPVVATNIVVGLLYTCDLQTLRLELEGHPTLQGSRKTTPQASVILDNASGLMLGSSPATVYTIPELLPAVNEGPTPLFSGVQHVLTGGGWELYGQISMHQPYPLPATVLGVVLETELGDDGA